MIQKDMAKPQMQQGDSKEDISDFFTELVNDSIRNSGAYAEITAMSSVEEGKTVPVTIFFCADPEIVQATKELWTNFGKGIFKTADLRSKKRRVN